MSRLDEVLGNAPTVERLKTALSGGSLPHAVLLCAADGCGRNFAARCLAADYLYPQGGSGADMVMKGESGEVLTATGEGASGMIPVDRIRELRRDIHRSALSASGRVVHICDAQNMAAPAANALLKVLEEPPPDALFILTAPSPAALMPTITSRCAAYTLAPLGQARCAELLADALQPGQDKALPALLAGLYGGRLGLGLRVLRDAARLAVVQDAITAVNAAVGRNEYSLLCLFARYEGRGDEEREKRKALLADMTDAISAALRGVQAPGLPRLPAEAAGLLLVPLADAAEALRRNAAPKLTFTHLAMGLCGAGLGETG